MKIYFPKMISFLAIATMLLTACGGGDSKKEDPDPEPTPDTTKPSVVTTVPSATGQKYAMTNSFLYTGTFTDNEDLKEVVFSLAHNKPASSASLKAATGVDDDPWEPTDFAVTLSGKTQTLTDKELFGGAIPSDVWTGTYTLTITCKDKADNVFTAPTIDVTIE